MTFGHEQQLKKTPTEARDSAESAESSFSPPPRSAASPLIAAPLAAVDDWLKRDRFVFIGWTGLILFPSAYLALGAWFTGTSFVSSFATHGLASSYREGCSFLTAAVSSPANCLGHSLLLAWGREARGSLPAWFAIGGLWAFVCFHGLASLAAFSLRQFEIARLVLTRPYNGIAFFGPISVFLAVFLAYPLGQSSWFSRRASE